jgi:hypothetical protein
VSLRSLIPVALLSSALGFVTSSCGGDSSCGETNAIQLAFDRPFPSSYQGTLVIAGRSVALAGCPMTGKVDGWSVSCRADGLSVSGSDLASNATLVIVTLLTADRFGTKNAVVPLGPSSPGEAGGGCERHGVVTLGLVGPDRERAGLAFRPAQLDLGSAPVGKQSVFPGQLMLENRALFAISPITLSVSGEFALGPTSCTALAVGMICLLQINFRPSTVGFKEGVLTASAPFGRAATATLTGVGLPPPDAAASD